MTSLKVQPGCCVALYDGYNFGGTPIKACNDIEDIRFMRWNNKASSLKIYAAETSSAGPSSGAGCTVNLYQHQNYGGIRNSYTRDAPTLTRNNDMSSLKVQPGCCVALYDDYNFRGTPIKTCNDIEDIRFMRWNNKASSLKIYSAENFSNR